MPTHSLRCSTAVLLALVPAVSFAFHPAQAQRGGPEAARRYVQTHRAEILRQYTELLSIPNLASDSAGIRRNAEWLQAALARRGLNARLLDALSAPPLVVGELMSPRAARTVVFYAHYDGQPVRTQEWEGGEPWVPRLRAPGEHVGTPTAGLSDEVLRRASGETRVYARSASDDKAPIIALLTALDALKAAGIAPAVNVKFVFEGEEEAGSPHLGLLLTRYRALLGGDLWVICDGPTHPSGRPLVVLGARGVLDVEMTVFGPARPLHSGNYGNWAPNPVALLADVLASLRDPEGRILIPGFYDSVRPPTARERAAARDVPAVDSALRRELRLARTEASDARLTERVLLPALNFRGLQAGSVGEGTPNAIPAVARASIDFRLVPDQTPEQVRALTERHLRARGYHVVHDAPDSTVLLAHPRVVRLQWGTGYPAERTALSDPAVRGVLAALADADARGPIVMPSLGGSVPLHLFAEALHVPTVVLPIVNPDNNQHAANENLRLQNLWDGVAVYATLMASPRMRD